MFICVRCIKNLGEVAKGKSREDGLFYCHVTDTCREKRDPHNMMQNLRRHCKTHKQKVECNFYSFSHALFRGCICLTV